MAEFIHEHSTGVNSEDGWLEFHPTDKRKSVLRTEQETSQPNRIAIEYWASGLEPIYLEGAFARAQGRLL